MPAFAATYSYAPDSEDLRAEHVAEHLAFMDELQEVGTLQLVGRIDDADVNILFVLRAESVDEARTALEGDPYVSLGVIAQVNVYPWTASRGALAPL